MLWKSVTAVGVCCRRAPPGIPWGGCGLGCVSSCTWWKTQLCCRVEGLGPYCFLLLLSGAEQSPESLPWLPGGLCVWGSAIQDLACSPPPFTLPSASPPQNASGGTPALCCSSPITCRGPPPPPLPPALSHQRLCNMTSSPS